MIDHPQYLPLPRTDGSPGVLLERCWHFDDGQRCQALSKYDDHRCERHRLGGEEHSWADAAKWIEAK